MATFNATSILIDAFLDELEAVQRRMNPGLSAEYADVIHATGAMAMEIIANTNAFYHNIEHSMMVTMVGQEILQGKFLRDGNVSDRDWMHFIVSLLCHDIGYVRGICPGDDGDVAGIDEDGNTVELPFGCTDAYLTPYHVERGKMFVRWRFRNHPVIDPEIIVDNIARTQFPVPSEEDAVDGDDYAGLLRGADLIGQLADPDYLRKLPALFYEFEETGANKFTGYKNVDDIHEGYPNFYWNMVHRHVGPSIDYLRVTREGRLWEACLYSNIFAKEHSETL